MARQITIVMYHYVRDLKRSRYPEIKGLSIDLFRAQLAYIMKYYHIVSMETLIGAIRSGSELPKKSVLLTFDDAYIDHFVNVFPILTELSVQGSFFPSAKAVMERKVLDVNKIHFILASVDDKSKIIEEIYSMLDQFRSEYGLMANRLYFEELAVASRFDTKEVVFIKNILQKKLPEKLRKVITDQLFNKYVTRDETAFHDTLYMNADHIKEMIRGGMYIGSHSFEHCWMDTLDKHCQEREVDLSLKFLQSLGISADNWVMCYPYGAYNDSLLSILKKRGCAAGLTTKVDIADLNIYNPLTLPRLDTNNLPKDKDSKPDEWTLKLIDEKA